MKLTKSDREELRAQMHKWLIEQGAGHKSIARTAKTRKWRELVHARFKNRERAKVAAQKAAVTRARARVLSERFKKYRPGATDQTEANREWAQGMTAAVLLGEIVRERE